MITWSRPPPGVFKINVAGYADDSMMCSTIGCVMRNISGYWIGGCYGKMEYESKLLTDIKAIYHGIKLAKDEGIPKIQVECNSDIAINHVLFPEVTFERSDIICEIHDMMETAFESCVLSPVPDSSNQLAIALSYYSIDEGSSIRSLICCPSELIQVMAADWLGS